MFRTLPLKPEIFIARTEGSSNTGSRPAPTCSGAFTRHADWTAANGDTFTTVFHGQLYPTDDPALLTFEVTHTVVDGTGRFNGATGSFTGVNGLFNLVTGEDSGGYLGTFSY